MARGMVGKKHSQESKDKISKNNNKYWSGKTLPQEMKDKISKSHIGKPPWNKGKKLSDEYRLKLSKAHIGKPSGRLGKKYPQFSGENHYNWKGGISTENTKIRNSFEMKLWRKACFERDNFTCQKTGTKGGDLAVHHINNFADFIELRTSIENGVTLSKESHKLFHHIYGNKNNTKEQLIEFMEN
jgi:hypothetical protein